MDDESSNFLTRMIAAIVLVVLTTSLAGALASTWLAIVVFLCGLVGAFFVAPRFWRR